ncbi:MAG: GIY-YIG nuclease family protein [Candidatus Pacebacteria bacterium]|nr:GIY-YIG nuclease family protein [Candidatus Paceibacterota bacterium]
MYFYIYVLLSEKDKKLYIGYTENLKLRFEEHQKGRVSSTKNRRPFQLIYSEACLDRKDAMHREKYLKTSYGNRFLKSRLKSYFTGCKNS